MGSPRHRRDRPPAVREEAQRIRRRRTVTVDDQAGRRPVVSRGLPEEDDAQRRADDREDRQDTGGSPDDAGSLVARRIGVEPTPSAHADRHRDVVAAVPAGTDSGGHGASGRGGVRVPLSSETCIKLDNPPLGFTRFQSVLSKQKTGRQRSNPGRRDRNSPNGPGIHSTSARSRISRGCRTS